MIKQAFCILAIFSMLVSPAMSQVDTPADEKPKPAVPLTAENMDKAVKKGVEYLLSKQNADGSWEPYVNANPHNEDRFPCGTTALVCYALLESGMSIDDAKLKLSIELLMSDAEKKLPQNAGDKKTLMGSKEISTYGLGLRCNVWAALLKQQSAALKDMSPEQKKNATAISALRERVKRCLRHDVARLVDTAYIGEGIYGYVTTMMLVKGRRPSFAEIKRAPPQTDVSLPKLGGSRRYGDNSNSQYGVMGVWAGAQTGEIVADIPPEFWLICLNHWMKTQWKDGHWDGSEAEMDSLPYTDRTMTAGGIASMMACFDELSGKKFAACKGAALGADWDAIQKGLKWMDGNLKNELSSTISERDKFLNFSHALARAGLSSGRKYFGEVDWFKSVAKNILTMQEEDGSFKERGIFATQDENENLAKAVGTAYAVLFLVKSRRPVLISKLEFGANWCNRPGDIAHLVRELGKTFGVEANWQSVSLGTNPDEWHDSRILYMASDKAAQLADADIAKIKRFIDQGGTLLATAECNGIAFSESIRELAAKMFPKYEFVPCPAKEHPLYSLAAKVDGDLKISEVTNGVRPLIILCETDLARAWQEGSPADKKYFDLAGNIVAYIACGKFPTRGVNDWPAAPASQPAGKIKVVKLPSEGNWHPEPLAWERFGLDLMGKNNIGIDVISAASSDKGQYASLLTADAKFAVICATGGKLEIDPQDIAALKAWVASGGTVLFESAGGGQKFADAAKAFINATWGPVAPLPLAHELYNYKNMKIGQVMFRRAAAARLGADAQTPLLEAVMIDGKPRVIFSREDITTGLLGLPFYSCDGYDSASAFDLMRNIVLYATGS